MNAPQRSLADVAILDSAANAGAAIAAAPANDEAALTTGKRLAAARNAQGLSLKDVHTATKIKLPHLVAIEADDRRALPATPFAAGFVKSYAQFLSLDANDFSAAWRREAAGETEAAPVSAAPAPTPAPKMLVEPVKSPPPPAPRVSNGEAQAVIAYTAMAAAAVAIAIFGANALSVRKPPVANTQSVIEEATPAPDATMIAAAAPTVETPQAATEIPVAEAAPQTPAAPPDDIPVAEPPTTLKLAPAARAPIVEETPAPVAAAPERDATPETTPTIIETPPVIELTLAPTQDNPGSVAPAMETDPAPTLIEEAPAREPVIVEAAILRAPAPRYPERCASSAAALEEVAILIDVAADGRAGNPRVAETSNACFDNAALSAAERMRFSPRTIDGFPTSEAARRVTIRFAR